MTTIVIERQPPASPERLFTGPGRWIAAGAGVIGAALQVAEFALENPSEDNTVRVAGWVSHPGAVAASQAVGLLAVPFLLAGFIVVLSITRQHSRRLSVVAGAFLTAAMAGLAGVHGVEMTAFGLATSGNQTAALSILNGDHVVAPMVVLLVLFLGGAALGTMTLAAAIWRSPQLPSIAAAGVVAFAVLDFAVGVPVISHLVALANSLVIAPAIWGSPQRHSRLRGGGAE